MEKKQLNQMNKAELTNILVNEYGYTKDDLYDENKKPYTNAALKAMVKKEEKEAELLEHEETATALVDSFEIKDDDMVAVMSGVTGELIHRSSRTGRMWKFTRFGQTDKMPFIELMSIYNNNPKCFEEGRLVVLNKQVADNFNLGETYQHIVTPQNLDGLILDKSPEDIKSTINSLPKSMKNTFFFRARELYKQDKLDSIKIARTIEECYGISLEDNAPISDIAVANNKEK